MKVLTRTTLLLVPLLLLIAVSAQAQFLYHYTEDEIERQEESDLEVHAALCGYSDGQAFLAAGMECDFFGEAFYGIHSTERSFQRALYRQRWAKILFVSASMVGQTLNVAGHYERSDWIHPGQFLHQTSIGWYIYSQRVTFWEAVGFTLIYDALLNILINIAFDNPAFYGRETPTWSLGGVDVPKIFHGRRHTELGVGLSIVIGDWVIRSFNK